MRPRLRGAPLFVSLIASMATAQALPPLPRIALENFPEAARARISRAYEAAAARSTDAQAVGELGRVLHAWEQWESAHEAYLRAQALAPRTFDWHYLDAAVLQRLARSAEAARRLKEAVNVTPAYAPARVKLAEALLDAGEVADATRHFEALSRDTATEPMGQFGLGRIAAAAGRHDAAVEHFRRAIALFPEWGSAHYALALSYRALGRREEAKQALDRHAEHGPQWPALEDPVLTSVSGLRDDARAILQRGVKLAEKGDLAGAIAEHEAALAQDPSLAQAHANLIALYGRDRNWAKADEHYAAVVRLGVELENAHYDYALVLGLQGKVDAAEAAYRKAIAVNPRHAEALNNLGELLERQRKIEAALDSYRRAADSRPLFRLARLNVGRMLMGLGKADAAVVELEKIVEPRDAEAPRYMFALGVAYVRSGRKEDGIKWATDARELALRFGQGELAAAIARDLAKLK